MFSMLKPLTRHPESSDSCQRCPEFPSPRLPRLHQPRVFGRLGAEGGQRNLFPGSTEDTPAAETHSTDCKGPLIIMKIVCLITFVSTLACAAIAQESRTVTKISAGDYVVLVDTNDAPDLKEWGIKAGTLCLEWFPKIAAALPSEGFVAPKEVTLLFDPKMNGVAQAMGGKITISANFVRQHSDDWGMVVHELTHVVQSYPPGGPGWLVEGIADYIRIVKFEPNAPRPKLDPAKASYKDAYKTTALFLEWVEKQQAPDFVVKINAALRGGKYRDELWTEITGKTMDELWALYATTL